MPAQVCLSRMGVVQEWCRTRSKLENAQVVMACAPCFAGGHIQTANSLVGQDPADEDVKGAVCDSQSLLPRIMPPGNSCRRYIAIHGDS